MAGSIENLDNPIRVQNYFTQFEEVATALENKQEVKITLIRPSIFREVCNRLRYMVNVQELVNVTIAGKEHSLYLPQGDRSRDLWEKVQSLNRSPLPYTYLSRVTNCLRRIFGQQEQIDITITNQPAPHVEETKEIATVFTDTKQYYEALQESGFFRVEKDVQQSYDYLQNFSIFDRLTPTEGSSEEDKQKIRSTAYRDRVNREIRCSDERFSNICVPLSRALAYMALFYQEKYGITIFLSDPQDIMQLLNRAAQNALASFGAIIYWNSTEGHVSTLIFKKTTTGRWEALLLDSLGGNFEPKFGSESIPPSFIYLKEKLSANNVPLVINNCIRQADMDSCHTEALIMLRNVLLDIKNREKEVDFAALENEIPAQWDYISQRQDDIDQPETSIIRDLHSKQPRKRNAPKTKEQFDRTYKRKVTVTERISRSTTHFTGTRESERNLYLLYKGAQIVSTIGKDTTRYTEDELNSRCIGFQLSAREAQNPYLSQ